MAEKWIQKAIKKPNALHKELGVPEDKKIPEGKLEKAAKENGSILGRKADLGYKEKAKFLDRGAISSQEIASFHLYLTQSNKSK